MPMLKVWRYGEERANNRPKFGLGITNYKIFLNIFERFHWVSKYIKYSNYLPLLYRTISKNIQLEDYTQTLDFIEHITCKFGVRN